MKLSWRTETLSWKAQSVALCKVSHLIPLPTSLSLILNFQLIFHFLIFTSLFTLISCTATYTAPVVCAGTLWGCGRQSRPLCYQAPGHCRVWSLQDSCRAFHGQGVGRRHCRDKQSPLVKWDGKCISVTRDSFIDIRVQLWFIEAKTLIMFPRWWFIQSTFPLLTGKRRELAERTKPTADCWQVRWVVTFWKSICSCWCGPDGHTCSRFVTHALKKVQVGSSH